LKQIDPAIGVRAGFTYEGLQAAICRESFYEFVKEFWDTLHEEPPVWNWHIDYICKRVQKMAERVFRSETKKFDLIINIPPGTTKSTLLSIMLTAWVWTRMPEAKIINATHTEVLGLDFARKCRGIIESDKYRRYFPKIKLREDQSKMGYFGNADGGWRLSVTIGGKSPLGFHGHFLIVDDPINPSKVFSESELKRANEFLTNTLFFRKVSKRVTVTILVMQRLHQNDPAGNWLERAKQSEGLIKVKLICLPAEETDKVHPRRLKKYYRQGMLDADRLDRKVLSEAKSQGMYSYSGQFLQDPVPPGGLLFDIDKIVAKDLPEFQQLRFFKKFVRSWDKAGTVNDGAYTVGVKMGLDPQGNVWIMDVVRGQWGVSQREMTIKTTAQLDGKEVKIVIEQEGGSGGKESAEATVRNLLGFTVTLDKPTGDKEKRADPFATAVNNGLVYMVRANWNDSYLDELRYFPRGTYKDQVDASTMAFAILTKPSMKIGGFPR